MEVGVVGRGRLGGSLAVLLDRAGHAVRAGSHLAPPDAPVLLVCVPDAAIAEVARTLPRGRVVLHTSGTTPVDALRPHAPAGSMHPLMTFAGPHALPELAGVPAAVDGDPEAMAIARELASSLGMRPIDVPGDRRLYHAAAVIAGNFATVLLAEAARALAAAGVPEADAPALLAPLARQSLANAALGPAQALTGPAARGDHATVEGHRAALRAAGLPELLPAYDVLTARAVALAGRSAAWTLTEWTLPDLPATSGVELVARYARRLGADEGRVRASLSGHGVALPWSADAFAQATVGAGLEEVGRRELSGLRPWPLPGVPGEGRVGPEGALLAGRDGEPLWALRPGAVEAPAQRSNDRNPILDP